MTHKKSTASAAKLRERLGEAREQQIRNRVAGQLKAARAKSPRPHN